VLENLEVAARYGHGTHDLDEVLAVTNLGRVASRLAEERSDTSGNKEIYNKVLVEQQKQKICHHSKEFVIHLE